MPRTTNARTFAHAHLENLALRSVVAFASAALALTTIGCKKERTLNEMESALSPGATTERTPATSGTAERLQRLFFAGVPTRRTWEDIQIAADGPSNTVVDLNEDECIGVLAVAGDTDVDLDMALISPDGLAVAIDDSPDAYPLIARYCVQRSGRYAMQLRANSATAAKIRLFDMPEMPGDDALRDLRQQIAEATGAELADETPPLTNAVREAGRYITDFAARAGHCYHALAVGTDSIHDLDIYVRDDSGEAIIQELNVDPIAGTSAFCVERTQRISVEFRAHRGAGSFRWQIVRADAPVRPPEGASAP